MKKRTVAIRYSRTTAYYITFLSSATNILETYKRHNVLYA